MFTSLWAKNAHESVHVGLSLKVPSALQITETNVFVKWKGRAEERGKDLKKGVSNSGNASNNAKFKAK